MDSSIQQELLEQLTQTKIRYEEHVHSLRRDRETLLKRVNDSESLANLREEQVNLLQREVNDYVWAMAEAKNTIKDLRTKDYTRLENNLREARALIEALENERKNVTEDYENLRIINTQLQTKLQDQRESMEKLQVAYDQSRQSIVTDDEIRNRIDSAVATVRNDYEERLRTSTETIEQLQHEVDAANQSLASSLATVQTLESARSSFENQLREVTETYAKAKDEWSNDRLTYDNKLYQYENERTTMEERYRTKENEYNQLYHEYVTLQEYVRDHPVQNTSVDYETLLQEKQHQIQQLQEQYTTLQQQFTDAQQQLQTTHDELHRVQEQLQSSSTVTSPSTNTEIDILQQQLRRKDNELENMVQQLQQIQSEITTLQTHAEHFRNSTIETQDICAQLTQQLDTEKLNHTSTYTELTKLTEQYQQLEGLYQDQYRQLVHLQEQQQQQQQLRTVEASVHPPFSSSSSSSSALNESSEDTKTTTGIHTYDLVSTEETNIVTTDTQNDTTNAAMLPIPSSTAVNRRAAAIRRVMAHMSTDPTSSTTTFGSSQSMNNSTVSSGTLSNSMLGSSASFMKAKERVASLRAKVLPSLPSSMVGNTNTATNNNGTGNSSLSTTNDGSQPASLLSSSTDSLSSSSVMDTSLPTYQGIDTTLIEALEGTTPSSSSAPSTNATTTVTSPPASSTDPLVYTESQIQAYKEDTENQLRTLQDYIQSLTTELETNRTENQQLQTTLFTAQTDATSIGEKLYTLQQEYSTLQIQYHEIDQQREQYLNDYHQQQLTVQNLTNEIEQLRHHLSTIELESRQSQASLTDDYTRLQTQYDTVQNELLTIRNALDEATRRAEISQQSLTEYEQTIHQQTNLIDQRTNELQPLQQRIEELTKEGEELRNRIAMYETTEEELEQAYAQTQEEIANHVVQYQELQSLYRTKETDYTELMTTYNRTEQQYNDTVAQLQILTETLTTERQQWSDERTDLVQKATNSTVPTVDPAVLDTLRAEHETEVHRWKMLVSAAQTETETVRTILDKEKETLTASLENLQQEVTALEKALESSEEKLEIYEDEMMELRERAEEAEGALAASEDKVEVYEGEAFESQQKVLKMETLVQNLRKTIAQREEVTKIQAEQVESERDDYRTKMQQLENEVRKVQHEYQSLQEQYSTVDTELQHTQERLRVALRESAEYAEAAGHANAALATAQLEAQQILDTAVAEANEKYQALQQHHHEFIAKLEADHQQTLENMEQQHQTTVHRFEQEREHSIQQTIKDVEQKYEGIQASLAEDKEMYARLLDTVRLERQAMRDRVGDIKAALLAEKDSMVRECREAIKKALDQIERARKEGYEAGKDEAEKAACEAKDAFEQTLLQQQQQHQTSSSSVTTPATGTGVLLRFSEDEVERRVTERITLLTKALETEAGESSLRVLQDAVTQAVTSVRTEAEQRLRAERDRRLKEREEAEARGRRRAEREANDRIMKAELASNEAIARATSATSADVHRLRTEFQASLATIEELRSRITASITAEEKSIRTIQQLQKDILENTEEIRGLQHQLSEALVRESDLVNHNQTLQNKITGLQNDSALLREELDDAVDQLSRMTSQKRYEYQQYKEETTERLKEAENKVHDYAQDKLRREEEYQKEVSELRSTYDSVRNDMIRLTAEYDTVRTETEILKEKLQEANKVAAMYTDCRKELDEVQLRLKEFQEHIPRYDEQSTSPTVPLSIGVSVTSGSDDASSSSSSSSSDHITLRFNELKLEYDTLRNQYNDTVNQYTAYQETSKQQMHQYTTDIDHLRLRIRQLENQIVLAESRTHEILQQQQTQTESFVNENNTAIGTLQSRIMELETQIVTVTQNHHDELSTTIMQHRQALHQRESELDETIDNLRLELTETRTRYETLLAEHQAQKVIDETRLRTTMEQEKVTEIAHQVQQLTERHTVEIDGYATALDEARNEADALRDAVHRATESMNTLSPGSGNVILQDLEIATRAATLQTSLDQEILKTEQLTHAVMELETERNNLLDQNSQTTEALRTLQERVTAAEYAQQVAENALAVAQTDYTNLVNELEQIRVSYEELQTNYANAELRVSTLEETLDRTRQLLDNEQRKVQEYETTKESVDKVGKEAVSVATSPVTVTASPVVQSSHAPSKFETLSPEERTQVATRLLRGVAEMAIPLCNCTDQHHHRTDPQLHTSTTEGTKNQDERSMDSKDTTAPLPLPVRVHDADVVRVLMTELAEQEAEILLLRSTIGIAGENYASRILQTIRPPSVVPLPTDGENTQTVPHDGSRLRASNVPVPTTTSQYVASSNHLSRAMFGMPPLYPSSTGGYVSHVTHQQHYPVPPLPPSHSLMTTSVPPSTVDYTVPLPAAETEVSRIELLGLSTSDLGLPHNPPVPLLTTATTVPSTVHTHEEEISSSVITSPYISSIETYNEVHEIIRDTLTFIIDVVDATSRKRQQYMQTRDKAIHSRASSRIGSRIGSRRSSYHSITDSASAVGKVLPVTTIPTTVVPVGDETTVTVPLPTVESTEDQPTVISSDPPILRSDTIDIPSIPPTDTNPDNTKNILLITTEDIQYGQTESDRYLTNDIHNAVQLAAETIAQIDALQSLPIEITKPNENTTNRIDHRDPILVSGTESVNVSPPPLPSSSSVPLQTMMDTIENDSDTFISDLGEAIQASGITNNSTNGNGTFGTPSNIVPIFEVWSRWYAYQENYYLSKPALYSTEDTRSFFASLHQSLQDQQQQFQNYYQQIQEKLNQRETMYASVTDTGDIDENIRYEIEEEIRNLTSTIDYGVQAFIDKLKDELHGWFADRLEEAKALYPAAVSPAPTVTHDNSSSSPVRIRSYDHDHPEGDYLDNALSSTLSPVPITDTVPMAVPVVADDDETIQGTVTIVGTNTENNLLPSSSEPIRSEVRTTDDTTTTTNTVEHMLQNAANILVNYAAVQEQTDQYSLNSTSSIVSQPMTTVQPTIVPNNETEYRQEENTGTDTVPIVTTTEEYTDGIQGDIYHTEGKRGIDGMVPLTVDNNYNDNLSSADHLYHQETNSVESSGQTGFRLPTIRTDTDGSATAAVGDRPEGVLGTVPSGTHTPYNLATPTIEEMFHRLLEYNQAWNSFLYQATQDYQKTLADLGEDATTEELTNLQHHYEAQQKEAENIFGAPWNELLQQYELAAGSEAVQALYQTISNSTNGNAGNNTAESTSLPTVTNMDPGMNAPSTTVDDGTFLPSAVRTEAMLPSTDDTNGNHYPTTVIDNHNYYQSTNVTNDGLMLPSRTNEEEEENGTGTEGEGGGESSLSFSFATDDIAAVPLIGSHNVTSTFPITNTFAPPSLADNTTTEPIVSVWSSRKQYFNFLQREARLKSIEENWSMDDIESYTRQKYNEWLQTEGYNLPEDDDQPENDDETNTTDTKNTNPVNAVPLYPSFTIPPTSSSSLSIHTVPHSSVHPSGITRRATTPDLSTPIADPSASSSSSSASVTRSIGTVNNQEYLTTSINRRTRGRSGSVSSISSIRSAGIGPRGIVQSSTVTASQLPPPQVGSSSHSTRRSSVTSIHSVTDESNKPPLATTANNPTKPPLATNTTTVPSVPPMFMNPTAPLPLTPSTPVSVPSPSTHGGGPPNTFGPFGTPSLSGSGIKAPSSTSRVRPKYANLSTSELKAIENQAVEAATKAAQSNPGNNKPKGFMGMAASLLGVKKETKIDPKEALSQIAAGFVKPLDALDATKPPPVIPGFVPSTTTPTVSTPLSVPKLNFNKESITTVPSMISAPTVSSIVMHDPGQGLTEQDLMVTENSNGNRGTDEEGAEGDTVAYMNPDEWEKMTDDQKQEYFTWLASQLEEI